MVKIIKFFFTCFLASFTLLFCACQQEKEAGSKNETPTDTLSEQQAHQPSTESDPDSLNGWALVDENEPIQEAIKPSFTEQGTSNSPINWQLVAEGVDYAEIDAPLKSSIGDSKIRIVRIDAGKTSLKMLCQGELQLNSMLTAEGYTQQFNLLASINTSMFAADARSVGFMKNFDYVNNGRLGKDKSIIAFNPKEDDLPAFKIIDLSCDDWEVWKKDYHSYIQNIRMIGCDGQVKWSKQEKFWSTACIAEDDKGRCLFIHSRSPYRVHDLAKMLLRLPLDIKRCCYAEGGPESSLHVNLPDTSIRSFGSYETGFMESDDNNDYWEIPNVLGIAK